MAQKVALITGGNTGIGLEAAVGLAEQGDRVIITSRNRDRGRAAVARIRDRVDGADVDVMDLDLASFASIRRFAGELLDRVDRLDVLPNNAGLTLSKRSVTEDGFETTFGVNHLGHFLLTNLLLERLEATPGARVVNVSSQGHKFARGGLDFDDLQTEHGYLGFQVYCRSKLANIYFTRELARRLAGSDVTANALHPGFVRSEFARGGDTGRLGSLGIRIAAPFAISPKKGARTSIYLASSPDVADVSGLYFYKCRPAAVSKVAADDDAARRLWEVSEQLVASVPV